MLTLLARARVWKATIDWEEVVFEWGAILTVGGGVIFITYLSIVGSTR